MICWHQLFDFKYFTIFFKYENAIPTQMILNVGNIHFLSLCQNDSVGILVFDNRLVLSYSKWKTRDFSQIAQVLPPLNQWFHLPCFSAASYSISCYGWCLYYHVPGNNKDQLTILPQQWQRSDMWSRCLIIMPLSHHHKIAALSR